MNEEEYRVGYKKPPKQHQFKKGQSGNPKGSSGAKLNPGRAMRKELDSKINISEDGKTRRISKEEAMAKRLVRSAAAGKWKDVKKALSYLSPEEITFEVIGFDSSGKRIN